METKKDTKGPLSFELKPAKDVYKIPQGQLDSQFYISNSSKSIINRVLDIFSQRNVFRVNDFIKVGNLSSSLQEKEADITGTQLQELLDIFLLASQRGGIHLHEFDTIQTICQFIEEITS